MEGLEESGSSSRRSRQKRLSAQEALPRIHRFCAYQERSHHEVREKLYSYGLSADQVEELISGLIASGFLNEERFAKAFAGGKFRIKKWGRLKIRRELESRGLTNRCIERGIMEIDTDDYRETLKEILIKRSQQSTEKNIFIKRDKIARFAVSKGFEPEMVWDELKLLLPDRGSDFGTSRS